MLGLKRLTNHWGRKNNFLQTNFTPQASSMTGMINLTEMGSIFWILAALLFIGGSIFCVAASLASSESHPTGGKRLRPAHSAGHRAL
jgi:hypothetical protein